MSAQIMLNSGGGPVAGSMIVGAAVTVTLSNFDNTGVLAWRWVLKDKPAGSAAALSSGTAAAPTITTDLPGMYVVELKTYKDAAATILDGYDLEAVGVRAAAPFDWLIPGAGITT